MRPTLVGLRHGVDVDLDGLAGLPSMPVFASGYVHPSDRKAFAMLGLGRDTVRTFTRTPSDAWTSRDSRARSELDGAPADIASAGEVNAGDFDPLPEMADLAERFDAWLHVDGAFGLFAALSDRTRHLVDGVERADSVIADGHKWLNVPYDCGFAFVRDASCREAPSRRGRPTCPTRSTRSRRGGTSGRRCRAGPVRSPCGRRSERTAAAATVRSWNGISTSGSTWPRGWTAPDLERLADVPLNIVCFRYRPPDVDEGRLDALNQAIGEAAIQDGRVFFGTTVYDGKVAFRPAPVNWRNRPEDVETIVEVVREVGAGSPGNDEGR